MVGPGSYLGVDSWHSRSESRKSSRPIFTANKKQRPKRSSPQPLPGPGQYDAKDSEYFAAPRATTNVFRSQTARFSKEKARVCLGPGEYIQHSTWIKDNKNTRSTESKPAFRVRLLAKSFPTIPIPGRSHGYQPSKDGRLVPREKTLQDSRSESTPELAQSRSKELPCRRYRGTYSVGPSKGRKMEDSLVPGPGSYTLKSQHQRAVTPAVRLNVALAARRNLEQRIRRGRMDLEARRDRAPGPGAYDLPGDRYRPQNIVVEEFGTTAQRFKPIWTGESLPGPGEYKAPSSFNVDRTISTYKKKNRHANGLGFAASSERFVHDLQEFGPGVGAYDVGERMRSAITRRRSHSGFGSTAARFHKRERCSEATPREEGSSLPDELLTNSLRHSDEQDTKKPHRMRRMKKVFKPVFSSENPPRDKEKDKMPDPGAYYVEKSWVTNAPASLKNKAKRFEHGPSNSDEHPGPGAYHVDESKKVNKAKGTEKIFGGEQRFKVQREITPVPGPGAYDTEFLNGNLLKRTFNITIAEEEESAILQAVRHGLC